MSNSPNASCLSGLQARAVAVLLEINHLRAIATDPATLDELGDVLDLIDQVSTLVEDGPPVDNSDNTEWCSRPFGAGIADVVSSTHAVRLLSGSPLMCPVSDATKDRLRVASLTGDTR